MKPCYVYNLFLNKTIIKHYSLRLSVVFVCVFFYLITLLSVNQSIANEFGELDTQKYPQTKIKKNLQDKYYRQALFFYFQNQPSLALQQLSYNKTRFNTIDNDAVLFEAGLQISLGLPQQAQQTLVHIIEQYQKTKIDIKESIKSSDSFNIENLNQQDLLVIALLQLAEQKIDHGDIVQTEQALAKIKHLPKGYYTQYYTLKQLVSWPEKPELVITDMMSSNSDIEREYSPYIMLNQALWLIQQQEYEQAFELLSFLKSHHIEEKQKGFWRSLFSYSTNAYDVIDSNSLQHKDNTPTSTSIDSLVENRALNDYARLLLAQMYVVQGRYSAAYQELEVFPEDSPHSEQALFLFAYSALKTKNYQEAQSMFTLLAQSFPYSNFTWQANGLLAYSYIEQNKMKQALVQYIAIEAEYKKGLSDLTNFQQLFSQQINLLQFSNVAAQISQHNEQTNAFSLSSNQLYIPKSPWLKKALSDVELSALYQQLLELDFLTKQLSQQQQKNDWLGEALILNKKRKNKIINTQQIKVHLTMVEHLKSMNMQLKQKLQLSTSLENGEVFANENERKWLARINNSKKNIDTIKLHQNTTKYNKRLKRIKGVLAWQLKMQLPARQWQHNKQLDELEQLLQYSMLRVDQVNTLLTENDSLLALEQRQLKITQEVGQLLESINQLRIKTNKNIKLKIESFISLQQEQLQRHILVTHRTMAKLIEDINKNKNKEKIQQAHNEKIQDGL